LAGKGGGGGGGVRKDGGEDGKQVGARTARTVKARVEVGRWPDSRGNGKRRNVDPAKKTKRTPPILSVIETVQRGVSEGGQKSIKQQRKRKT